MQFANHGFTIILSIVLARILSPSDFGLVAMVLVISDFSRIILDFGFGQALIHKQDVRNIDYSTVFWFNVISGGLLSILVLFGAEYFSRFYNMPILKPLTMVLSVNYFLASFSIVPQIILTKNIDFKSLAKIRLLSIVISGISGIWVATFSGIWALVYIEVCRTFLISLFSIIVVKEWKPNFLFELNSLKSIFKFSANLFGNESLNYWMDNFDKLIIGRFLGDYSLGLYRQAYSFMLLPVNNISRVLNSVLFPVLSTKQDDREYISKTFVNSISYIYLIIFPALTLLFVSSASLVKLLLGEKWIEMIVILQYFSIAGIFYSVSELTHSFFLSLGKTEVLFRANILIRIILIAAILFALKYKLEGVALAILIVSPVKFLILAYSLNKVVRFDVLSVFKKLIFNIIASVLIALSISLISNYFFINISNILKLLFYIICIPALFLLFYHVFFYEDLKSVRYHVGKIFKLKTSN